MSEVLSVAQMAAADQGAIAAGVPSFALMRRAGQAVADTVAAVAATPVPVAIVAGPGNNGGDGFVAARVLTQRGFPVRVFLLGSAEALRGDAATAAAQWSGPVEDAASADFVSAEIIVDALFGAGLARPLAAGAAALVHAINAAGARVVAVDLPSGVDGDSGTVLGTAVSATETVTFFRKKPGHLLMPGRVHCGAVRVADIGIPASVLHAIGPRTFENTPALWRADFPVPSAAGHKYTRGHAVAVSGGVSSTGAARLAARGALRAGAGLVTIASPRAAMIVNAAASLAVMVRPVDGPQELSALLSDQRLNAVVAGPGLGVGAATCDLVRAVLSSAAAVVLDADALTSFAPAPRQLFDAIAQRSSRSTVLTPHAGEFSRLFGEIAAPSKLEAARAAARRSGAVVVFKGPDTVVASPDGRAAIAANASPWLATAGSGDVLAGMTAGLLAQGMPAFEAASAAVWLHGEAGRVCGPGLISEDLPEALPAVLRDLVTAENSGA